MLYNLCLMEIDRKYRYVWNGARNIDCYLRKKLRLLINRPDRFIRSYHIYILNLNIFWKIEDLWKLNTIHPRRTSRNLTCILLFAIKLIVVTIKCNIQTRSSADRTEIMEKSARRWPRILDQLHVSIQHVHVYGICLFFPCIEYPLLATCYCGSSWGAFFFNGALLCWSYLLCFIHVFLCKIYRNCKVDHFPLSTNNGDNKRVVKRK